jgi:hypothetical protein
VSGDAKYQLTAIDATQFGTFFDKKTDTPVPFGPDPYVKTWAQGNQNSDLTCTGTNTQTDPDTGAFSPSTSPSNCARSSSPHRSQRLPPRAAAPVPVMRNRESLGPFRSYYVAEPEVAGSISRFPRRYAMRRGC